MGLLNCGGALLIKLPGGITKLSELTIDADKDWQGFGIFNIKEVAAAMAKGDLAIGGSIVKLTPGAVGLPLTSAGAGNTPTWG